MIIPFSFHIFYLANENNAKEKWIKGLRMEGKMTDKESPNAIIKVQQQKIGRVGHQLMICNTTRKIRAPSYNSEVTSATQGNFGVHPKKGPFRSL